MKKRYNIFVAASKNVEGMMENMYEWNSEVKWKLIKYWRGNVTWKNKYKKMHKKRLKETSSYLTIVKIFYIIKMKWKQKK